MTEQEMREKVIKGLEHEIGRTELEWLDCVEVALLRDALVLLKAQENEIKALRLLVDWAEECDFGLDNIRWREYVTKEELDKVEDYIEKMIYVARKAVEQG